MVQQCRKSHQGPVDTEDDMNNQIIEKFQDDNSKLRSALIYEIRYRKFTVMNIKDDNPLFKQKGLSIEQLKENLKLLMTKTDRSLASTVTMDDLTRVVGKEVEEEGDTEAGNEIQIETEVEGQIVIEYPEAVTTILQKKKVNDTSKQRTQHRRNQQQHQQQQQEQQQQQAERSSSTGWPPYINDHVAVRFVDGFYIGEVVEVLDNETLRISYMQPKTVLTASPSEHKRKFWIWPFPPNIKPTKRNSISNIRPADLKLTTPPLTRRSLVFSCGMQRFLINCALGNNYELS